MIKKISDLAGRQLKRVEQIRKDDWPEPPGVIGTWFSRAPAWMAFDRRGKRKGNGRHEWRFTEGELRYAWAIGAHTDGEGNCRASQVTLARKLGISRALAGKWERGLIRKGGVEAIPVARVKGRWRGRLLRLIYRDQVPEQAKLTH